VELTTRKGVNAVKCNCMFCEYITFAPELQSELYSVL
jgi:hypothetical protein